MSIKLIVLKSGERIITDVQKNTLIINDRVRSVVFSNQSV